MTQTKRRMVTIETKLNVMYFTISYLNSSRNSLALYVVMIEVTADGTIIIGVRDRLSKNQQNIIVKTSSWISGSYCTCTYNTCFVPFL